MKGETVVFWITGQHAFAAWTPQDVVWSQWASPVAFVTEPDPSGAPAVDELPPCPPLVVPFDPHNAVIVDLPGAESVAAGLALADAGACPVPLFNGTPGPAPVVDVDAICRALVSGAERVRRVRLPADAPPAFLLDSRRLDRAALAPGMYDNRWVALPQDFPSGALLASRGIRTATLIRRGGTSVPTDLAHVLRRWAEQGIGLRVVDVDAGHVADNVTVPVPSRFKRAWYAALAMLGLQRSDAGGFGGTIPDETENGGHYG